jgi:hypothetical protein
MRDMTEQEKLAQLMSAGTGNAEAEAFDSADLLTQGLMNQLGGVNQHVLAEVQQEIASRGEHIDPSPISSFSSEKRAPVQGAPQVPQKDVKLIKTLKVVHQGLIDVFERSGLNSGVEDNLVHLIDAMSACLNYLSEPTEKFEPLRHLSGLQAPNLVKSAERVVDTTLNCYKVGKVESHEISEDGSTIKIAFTGKHREIEYNVLGEVTAKYWEGNEAIDYIYTPGSGKMSIKSFEGGKWVDQSDNRNYQICWELSETDTSLPPVTAEENNPFTEESDSVSVNNDTVEEIDTIATEENTSDKEEVSSQSLNNGFNEDDEDIAFPISD